MLCELCNTIWILYYFLEHAYVYPHKWFVTISVEVWVLVTEWWVNLITIISNYFHNCKNLNIVIFCAYV